MDIAQISVEKISGKNKNLLEKLHRCGIFTVQDLLLYLPYRYQDRTRITPLKELKPFEFALVEGTITYSQIFYKKRKFLLVILSDGYSQIALRFFHFHKQQVQNLSVGTRLRCFGEVRYGFQNLEMVHPECRRVKENDELIIPQALTPVYPVTEGLTYKMLHKLILKALAFCKTQQITEYFPKEMISALNFPPLLTSLVFIHQPPPDVDTQSLIEGKHPAINRFAFEELLAHRLSLLKLRAEIQCLSAPQLHINVEKLAAFHQQLPFQLTAAQQQVVTEIFTDLSKTFPMQRLLQGDVGSGKTVVAAHALLAAVMNGYQAAIMAPTDILSEQHYHNLTKWFAPLDIQLVWLAGKHKGKQRNQALNAIETGAGKIIIGTHALFQDAVVFNNLALVVVDEQHRFGVQQRFALKQKAKNITAHQLIMTATPIPRTLAMTFYADLDVSTINSLPPNRSPIITVAMPNQKREEVIARIRNACQEGKQVYWVCTLIENSEILESQAAITAFEALQRECADCRIGLVHGKMKSQEKDAVMLAFKQGEIQILVATTVIEVGVDVPNASLMIIENAERLGLSQLHQLRGRVGRGTTQSYCVLLYQSPLAEIAKQRLQILRDSQDGFLIAQKDLELRGAGEVLGTKQTGAPLFKIANISRDRELMKKVVEWAPQVIKKYPNLCELIIKRWIGDRGKYAQV